MMDERSISSSLVEEFQDELETVDLVSPSGNNLQDRAAKYDNDHPDEPRVSAAFAKVGETVSVSFFKFRERRERNLRKMAAGAYEESTSGALACPIVLCLTMVFLIAATLPLLWPILVDAKKPEKQSFLTENLINHDESTAISTPDCENDAACKVIMDAITPEMSESMLEAIHPRSCQWQARQWLKSNNDLLLFTSERIRQRYALSVFYCETDGKLWLQNDAWLSDNHECDWFNGIGDDGCDRNEELTILRLPENQLEGTLPPELSLLTSLHELTFSNNFLKGTIPQEYAKLTALDTFCVSFNLLHGGIPDFLFQFQEMTYLDVSQNDFSGTIPEDLLSAMTNLELFSARGNKDLVGTGYISVEDSKN